MLADPKWDLDKPSLRGLAYVLRHPELWPSDFVWEFSDCDACAMGLAFRLWDLGEHPWSFSMTEHFPISEQTSIELFTYSSTDVRGYIPPEEIAARIEAYLGEA
jgi:hypothetical protein